MRRPLERLVCYRSLKTVTTWNPRAGLYYWAGPGTVRMTNLKFFNPAIDEAAFERAYDKSVLETLQSTLGLTDAWVTYSWGFSDRTEREDRQWLRARLPNFQALGIKTHAYVQGPNVVTADFSHDLLCRDRHGQPIPYHRGRHLTCPLNPRARALLIDRVEAAAREDVDGVFVDNFFFGKFPLPTWGITPFFGCACAHCRLAFWGKRSNVPTWLQLDDPLTADYLAFRTETMGQLAVDLAAICRRYGKLYGSNGLDLGLDPRLFYGYDPQSLARAQSYLLTENFNHPSRGRTNAHLKAFTELGVPLATVSYVQSIGRHAALTQRDIDGAFSDAVRTRTLPVYKGSEFVTNGCWHPLAPDGLREPMLLPAPPPSVRTRKRGFVASLLQLAASRYQTRLQGWMYESKLARYALGGVVDRGMEAAASLLGNEGRRRLSPSA